jgi:hypothetical protein
MEEDGFKLFEPWDLIHLPLLVLCRILIISVKYGFYSTEHFQIFKSIDYPKGFITIDLLTTTLFGKDTDFIRSRMVNARHQLGFD